MNNSTISATLRVLIEGQAQMYADIVRLKSETPVDDKAYMALINEWKQETADLIEDILDREWDEEQQRIEEGYYTDDAE